MTSDLWRAVERLRMSANKHDFDRDMCIDGTLLQQRPRKRTKIDTQALKKELEKDFLTPQTSFDVEWLDKLQQYVVQPRGVRIC
ncbi:hypothetical protein HO173_006658 [Letharia columbiana]|uniref:Uncharacterized protein n=1 Tax=Letharia columbiana TaxID=112416 RepID=A0A8H6L4C2_9LECA|nr:uncharacterized protein HO173_006658 [Letharia columbiana]KAF6235031.1 hypothetical protein HO173_006658 [Letharia columbiana]